MLEKVASFFVLQLHSLLVWAKLPCVQQYLWCWFWVLPVLFSLFYCYCYSSWLVQVCFRHFLPIWAKPAFPEIVSSFCFCALSYQHCAFAYCLPYPRVLLVRQWNLLTATKNWRDWIFICFELVHQYPQRPKIWWFGDPCECLSLELDFAKVGHESVSYCGWL